MKVKNLILTEPVRLHYVSDGQAGSVTLPSLKLRQMKWMVTWRFVMRVGFFYMALLMSSIQLLMASSGNGQGLDEIQVKLELRNGKLESLFKKIKKQTALEFAFVNAQVDNYNGITLPEATRTVKETLDLALKGTNLRYIHQGSAVVIIEKVNEENTDELIVATDSPPIIRDNIKEKSTETQSEEPEVKSDNEQETIGSKEAETAPILVTGKVTDSKGAPMAGVNVLVKGTSNQGTVTDSEGKFTLQADDNDVLVFSFIGFKTFEITVSGRTVIDVSLEEDVKSLNEVVVNAGYWQVKDRERTGNISKVTADVIEKQPVLNPLAALQDRVPGLQITQLTGVPGGNFTVRLRGQNSIASGNDPLYIIDGAPFTSTSMAFPITSGEILTAGTNPLNSINPNDIESIEILKDADATAIYGSRGANGVILITTKRGQEGKTKFDLNFYHGAGKVASKIDLLTTQQYLEMRKEAFQNDARVPTISIAPDLLLWDTTRYTDWQRVLIGGTAQSTDAQLSVSGGDASTVFLFGGGLHRETTVFPTDNSTRRISTHFSLTNSSPNKKIKTLLSANFAANHTNLLKQDLTSVALTLPPNAPKLYSDDGELNWENSTWVNPVSYLKRKFQDNTQNLLLNAVLTYVMFTSLEIKSSIGYTNTSAKAVTTTPTSSLNPAFSSFGQNESAFSSSNFQNWIWEPQVNWKPQIGVGSFDVLIGATFLNQESDGTAQYATGFVSESLMEDIGSASNVFVTESNSSLYRYGALFGRINYILNGKYNINLTGRRDGSSRFGPDKQFANFGAFGLAWIFSKEMFIQSAFPFLSFGKLRTSYGITGNDQIGDYQFLDSYTSSGLYQGINGLNPSRLYNPDFGWETNRKFEAAIDLGLLDNRISIETSYYFNKSSNQLVGYPLPPTTGFASVQSNLPAVIQNTGIEFDVNTINIQNQDITWSTTLNFSIPRNKLVEYPNLEGSSFANRYVVGEPLNIKKAYHSLGVDSETGIYQFEDINEDGVFSTPDLTTVKVVGQKFYGGFQNSIQYKGIQFDVSFQFVKQTGHNYLSTGWGAAPGARTNQPAIVLNRWQEAGDAKNIQRFTSLFSNVYTAYSRLRTSDLSITDASFIRLKNVSLSYSLDESLAKKIGTKGVKLFIQGQNLLTVTKYEGIDPENQNSVLPPLRMLTGGLHLTF